MEEKNKELEFNLDGRNYYFDLKQACLFVTDGKEGGSGRVEREILNNYEVEDPDEGLTISSKSVREITGPGDGTMDNIRYDLLKLFIIQIITFVDKNSVTLPDAKDAIELPVICIEGMPLGTRLAFNTLLNASIIKLKEEEKIKK